MACLPPLSLPVALSQHGSAADFHIPQWDGNDSIRTLSKLSGLFWKDALFS